MRAFISINIHKQTKDKIAAIQRELRNKINNPHNVKFENSNNFHLTLFFIGEIDERKLCLIKDELSDNIERKFGELNFNCNEINAFPNLKKPRVIFLNCINKENKIFELAEKIKNILNSFGYNQDKPFHPHITLARVKNRIHLNDFSDLNAEINFSISEISIMKSELTSKGAIHQEVFAINL